jgi:hypothetical protein
MLQSEVRGLKERLLMGQEEYKRQFVTAQKLQSECRRLQRSHSLYLMSIL